MPGRPDWCWTHNFSLQTCRARGRQLFDDPAPAGPVPASPLSSGRPEVAPSSTTPQRAAAVGDAVARIVSGFPAVIPLAFCLWALSRVALTAWLIIYEPQTLRNVLDSRGISWNVAWWALVSWSTTAAVLSWLAIALRIEHGRWMGRGY